MTLEYTSSHNVRSYNHQYLLEHPFLEGFDADE